MESVLNPVPPSYEELQPEEIAAHHFSRTLFGLNPAEVRQFLREVATALTRTIGDLSRAALDRALLEASVKDATEKAADLEKQLAANQEQLTAYREMEGRIPRAIMEAERIADEVTGTARAQAEEAIAEARRAADQVLEDARRTAAQTLRDARGSAEEAIRASHGAAEQQLVQAQIDAEWTRDQARQAAAGILESANSFVSEWMGTAQRLEALVQEHTDALNLVARLRAHLGDELLPSWQKALEDLRAIVPGPASLPGARVPPRPGAQTAPAEPRRPPSATPRAQPPLILKGDIVAGPFPSYLRMTKFFTAVSRLPGVTAARVAAFSEKTATIEIALEGKTLADLDVGHLDGFQAEVVEATPTRLRLRIVEGGG